MTPVAVPGQDVIATLASGGLAPVVHRWRWILSGLVLQVAGVAAPIAYVLDKAKHENVGGTITRATFRLAWYGAAHSMGGVGLLAGGALVFVAGCVLLARPFVKSRRTLMLAIPVAAIAGVLVLGAAALLVAALLASLSEGFDFGDGTTNTGNTGPQQNPASRLPKQRGTERDTLAGG